MTSKNNWSAPFLNAVQHTRPTFSRKKSVTQYSTRQTIPTLLCTLTEQLCHFEHYAALHEVRLPNSNVPTSNYSALHAIDRTCSHELPHSQTLPMPLPQLHQGGHQPAIPHRPCARLCLPRQLLESSSGQAMKLGLRVQTLADVLLGI